MLRGSRFFTSSGLWIMGSWETHGKCVRILGGSFVFRQGVASPVFLIIRQMVVLPLTICPTHAPGQWHSSGQVTARSWLSGHTPSCSFMPNALWVPSWDCSRLFPIKRNLQLKPYFPLPPWIYLFHSSPLGIFYCFISTYKTQWHFGAIIQVLKAINTL